MAESAYKNRLIRKLEVMFPGCIITRLPAEYIQGIPDLLILWGPHWATLEVKTSAHAKVRPNQPYYVDRMNTMSFSAFVYPENEDEVLNDLQLAFGC